MPDKTIYFDDTNQRECDSLGIDKTKNPSRLAYQAYEEWALKIRENSAGTLTAKDLTNCTAFKFAVDYDFDHDLLDGELTAAFSGAVTSITADGFATAPPLAGVLHLSNGSDPEETISYSSYTVLAGVYTFTVGATLIYSYSENDQCDAEDTAPMVRVLDANIDSSDKGNGNIVPTVDADTSTFANATSEADSDGYFKAWAALYGYNSSAKRIFKARWEILAEDVLDPNTGVPPGVSGDYYDKTEIDAMINGLFVNKMNVASLAVDFKTAQENIVYTVPSGYLCIPSEFIGLGSDIDTFGSAHTYRWLAGAVDLTGTETSNVISAGPIDKDNYSGNYYPAGTVFKYEVVGAATGTTVSGKVSMNFTLIAV